MLCAACRAEPRATAVAGSDSTATSRSVAAVRARYQSSDMIAAGAWTWVAPDGTTFVLIDAQSTVEDLVQARAVRGLLTSCQFYCAARMASSVDRVKLQNHPSNSGISSCLDLHWGGR